MGAALLSILVWQEDGRYRAVVLGDGEMNHEMMCGGAALAGGQTGLP